MVSILAAFPSLDDAWQYMMSILDQTQRIEVAEDVAHLHVLWAEKMGYEHQNMTVVLKRDWKSVGMTKKTMTALVSRLQPYVTASKKTPVTGRVRSWPLASTGDGLYTSVLSD